MQETLIDQGLNLMLFGMGTVFVFLTILVFATSLMSKVVSRLTPEQEPTVSETPSATNNSQADPRIIAAITKAIKAHRQR